MVKPALAALSSCVARLACALLLGLSGCEALYQSYNFTEPLQTTLPVQVSGDEVWITSLPPGAEVYIQPYTPGQVPSHATAPEALRGKTPLRITLPPGSYWLELALEADVFESYFTPPYDDAQFELEGATSEALLFRPFAPGEKRRVLRYYQLEKQHQQGQTLIALFHPRGAPLERVAALYPSGEQYRFAPDELRDLLQRVQVPRDLQEGFLVLLRRGGKAFWSMRDEYSVALEVRQNAIEGRIVALYTGTPLPDPLIPDGGM
ncbi:MAG: hypothetical protein AB7N91_04355 [Candidatus Tectimicrobiota bacterium]